MKATKLKILLIALPVFFIACKPDKDDYTEKWIGNWQTTDDTRFPQAKYLHTGAIVKDNGERNKVILSGTLLGINSSYKIPVKLSSRLAGTVNYSGDFAISGRASCNDKDSIWLYLQISGSSQTVKDTVILVKSQSTAAK